MNQKNEIKHSNTSGSIPTTSSLHLGQIAINSFDGKVYIKKNNGVESIIEIGGGSGSSGPSISASYAESASYAVNSSIATTASYVLNAISASYADNSSTASWAISASWAPNSLSGGTDKYIPLWTGSNSLTSSVIYQTNNNVLIGTTTDASYKLDVIGSARIAKDLVINSNSTTASFPLIVTSNTGSGYGIQLKHPTTYNTYIAFTPTGWVFNNSALTPASMNATATTFDIAAPVASTFVLRIGGTSANNIISANSGSLRFNPAASNIDTSIYGDSDVNLFYVDASADSIGIGKLPVNAKLDVSGSTIISGSFRTTEDIYVNGDIRIGRGLINSNTNTLVGSGSFSIHSSGVNNTILGSNILIAHPNANYTTLVGSRVATSLVSGLSNTMMGYNVAASMVTGSWNTFIGQGAGAGFNGGNDNVFLGQASGYNFYTGSANIILGGANAGTVRSGSYNLHIGYNTGINNNGSQNIFIGYASSNNMTSGSYNVIIGSNNGSIINGTNNNVIFSDGQGNLRLFIPSTGNVLIGTTTDASYKLDVSGSGRFTNGLIVTGSVLVTGSILSTGSIETNSTIKTANPGNGAGAWKLGQKQTATVSLDTSGYLEIEIDGNLYYIALAQLP